MSKTNNKMRKDFRKVVATLPRQEVPLGNSPDKVVNIDITNDPWRNGTLQIRRPEILWKETTGGRKKTWKKDWDKVIDFIKEEI